MADTREEKSLTQAIRLGSFRTETCVVGGSESVSEMGTGSVDEFCGAEVEIVAVLFVKLSIRFSAEFVLLSVGESKSSRVFEFVVGTIGMGDEVDASDLVIKVTPPFLPCTVTGSGRRSLSLPLPRKLPVRIRRGDRTEGDCFVGVDIATLRPLPTQIEDFQKRFKQKTHCAAHVQCRETQLAGQRYDKVSTFVVCVLNIYPC